jgi:mTERF domain-containing protein
MSSRNEDDDDDDDDDKSDGRSYLCLSRSEVSQVVSKFPPTLWLSEGNLRSKLDYLVTSLGLVGPDLRNIIVTYPQILGLSLEGNLVPKVDFFIDDAGLCRDQLREFVLYQPALLAYSLEGRLRPRIARMRERNISL